MPQCRFFSRTKLAIGWLVVTALCAGGRARADALDDALTSIKCTRADLAIPTDIRWRDPFRLEVIDRLLTHPLVMPDYCQTLAEELAKADSLEALIAKAGERLELPVASAEVAPPIRNSPKLKNLPEVQEALDILWHGTLAADADRQAAFAPLSKTEYVYLSQHRRQFVTLIRGEENFKPFDEQLLGIARKVDYAALTRAGMVAARAVEAAEKVLHAWKPATTVKGVLLDTVTPLGRVVVGGMGDDVYTGKPIAILIELGGNDTYRCVIGAGVESVALAIDLAGDDKYECADGFAFGAGDLGVGILLDGAGDDYYAAGNGSLGSALFGVGVFVDRAGMDSYNVDEHGEGAANFGIGILLDEQGNDTYLARHFAQAAAGPLSFALLLDRAGDDTYFIGGKHRGWSTSETSSRSAGQGFAQGIREYASGGIAFLVDVAGKDSYRGGAVCQGVSYWFALGVLVDGAGNDTYQCLHYGQGGPFHFGVGALLDNAGDDVYRGGVATTGMGYDWSAGILVDYAGNDLYEGAAIACGGGGVNGVGIFCDNAGDDVYRVKGGSVLGGGQWVERRASGSLGLFFDFDGNDRYSSPKYDNEKSWTQDSYGAGMDLKAGKPLFTKVAKFKPVPVRPPVARPEPPTLPADARELFEIMVEGAGATKRALQAQEKFLAQPAQALPVLMDNVVVKPYYRSYGVSYSLLPKLGTNAVPALLTLLKNPDPWLRCRAADVLGKFKPEEATTALPALRSGLTDEHFMMRTACVQALGKLGDKESAATLAGLLSDPHLAVRVRAAEALGLLKVATTEPALRQALNDPNYQVRYGAQRALDALAGQKPDAK